MAERRPPGFNVPLGFYDGPEVKSIPRRIRAAAVGVWTLCGTFSANKLQDGYVGPETLKELCCTAAIRSALMATKGPDGDPDALWIDARDGGIQFTKWVKYQRSRAEVKAYLSADAERKRNARNAAKGATTSDDSEMSGRTSAGHPPDHRDPKTETDTKTEISGYVFESAPDSTGRTGTAATIGAELVAEAGLPESLPGETLAKLRIKATLLVKDGSAPADVRQALQAYGSKTGVSPGILTDLVADVVKRRNGQAMARNGPAASANGLSAGEAKVAGWANLGQIPNPNGQKAIDK